MKYTPHIPYENGTFVSDIGMEHWADLTRVERPVNIYSISIFKYSNTCLFQLEIVRELTMFKTSIIFSFGINPTVNKVFNQLEKSAHC